MAALAALLGIAMLAVCPSAWALSGAPFKIAEGEFDGPPAVAVDSSGTSYVAWANEASSAVSIHWCVIPAGATACEHSGEVKPSLGAESHVRTTDILVEGSTVAILADAYGNGGDEESEPIEEWTSTNGGASFAAVDSGKSVVNGTLDTDSAAMNAVVLPGSDVLGLGWVTPTSEPTFAAFPLSSSTQCSLKKACEFAGLQPGVTENLLGNPGGSIAAQSGTSAGVLGVYETLGKPGCSSGAFDSAFVFGAGEQGSTNSYNISPGKSDSAWRLPLTAGDCEVEYLAADGGPSGFGVLEDDLAANTTVYHRFDQAHEDFDTPYATVASEGEESPAVSQDGAGGVYATYLAGFRGEVRLAYSYNGGETWSGPVSLAGAGGDDLNSSVSAGGQGWATWKVGEATYVQQFDAADSLVPPTPVTITTTQRSGTAGGADISIPAGTVGETDQATLAGTDVAYADGTTAYGLYSSRSCTASSLVFESPAQSVSGGLAPASQPVSSPLPAGTYYWLASYSGNGSTTEGVKGNDAGLSACGSETLTVTSPYKDLKLKSGKGGAVTIELVPLVSGVESVELTLPTALVASTAKAKKCKHGQIKLKGECRPATTVVGRGSARATAGRRLKLTIHLTGKARGLYGKGHTLRLTVVEAFKPATGGSPYLHDYSLPDRGR